MTEERRVFETDPRRLAIAELAASMGINLDELSEEDLEQLVKDLEAGNDGRGNQQSEGGEAGSSR